ncbi:non-ribosomal peptide synthetase [Streptomyces sp. NBC_00237]|uniref:non-ribosomal peptide synthetase n=1 Tax=Streptomyces sp. NBC_00237 TaxID=2975687 RepID=UPI0022563FD2|nr:non-ribosomal peptide synthetase [Streptomyces sp. NBC_00237]MCX5206391.1 non-ribosomal peptide synthetase [Streptomyces sp. NBC_00237]
MTTLPNDEGLQDMTPRALPSLLHGKEAPQDPTGVLARYEEWVRRTPDSPAVLDGAHSWTYGEIDAAADALIRTWDGRLRPGDLVGVCLDRSAALVVTTVALARVGAVCLPLGPRPGERRLAAVGEDVGVACLIGAPDVLPPAYREAGQGDAEHLALPLPEAGANAVAGVVAAFLPPTPGAHAAPANALYAVLTSGSTGRPKAVAVAEPALRALLGWYRAETGIGPGDRQSLLIGVAFDPHVMELWAGLTSGAALVPAPDAVRWDPAALVDWWREAGVTVAVSATPMIEPLLDADWPQDLTLRHLIVGGDRMRRRPGPDVTCVVHNAYGPAEATVVTTTHAMRATDADVHEEAAPPIGIPLPGVSVLVTDPEGRVVPRGEDGELRIGGAQLAIGYLDPELTERRFVAASPTEEGRAYRTGDRVRMRADGVLDFLGRLDDQVKISGVRIEPAEVEAALEQDPAVRGAVVVAPRDAEGRARLVAYVLPAAGAAAPPAPDALLAAVRGWLPEQAVPSAVRIVDAFALDANGKVDRAALLKQEERTDTSGAALGVEGASTNERLVLGTVRELLGRADVALTDNFTDVGGTSLVAARLLAAIEREAGVRLRAPELLRQPDLRAVVALLDARCAATLKAAV